MRPKTKQELLLASTNKFNQLIQQIAAISPEEQEEPMVFNLDFLATKKEAHWKRDRSLKDILIHLYEWHQLLLNWVTNNQNGKKSPFLPAPYNWRNYGQMNISFVEKHRQTTLKEAKKQLLNSHKKVITELSSFTDAQLFKKNQFAWVGNTTLGSYFTSATASHYDWAIKKVKQYQKHKIKNTQF